MFNLLLFEYKTSPIKERYSINRLFGRFNKHLTINSVNAGFRSVKRDIIF